MRSSVPTTGDMIRSLVVLLLALFWVGAPLSADEVEHDDDVEPVARTVQPEAMMPPRLVDPEQPTGEWRPAEDRIPETAFGLEPEEVASFRILDEEVSAGSIRRLSWFPDESADGLPEATPVLVAHGKEPGPVLCLTAAVHGDELNGIEIVRELLYDLDAERLNGTIIGVPIVNLYGFRQNTRYLPDRRDLNRYFPGNPRGSFASRVAYSFFHSIVKHCDWLVDLHTGSFQRTNLPQLRADLDNDDVVHLTKGFGATVVLHGGGPDGSLRRAATDAGIPAVVVEAGEPSRFEPDQVAHGVRALRSVLNHLDMMSRFTLWQEPQPTYYESSWVRAEGHGILSSRVELGQTVREGAVLGTITDPITSARWTIRTPYDGRILGMALNQSVRPGYAIYHIGIRRSESGLREGNGDEEPLHDARLVAPPTGSVPGE